MLKERILSTIRFFDLQDYPLTLLELHRFLIADMENLKQHIDRQGEIIIGDIKTQPEIGVDQILVCLDSECDLEIKNTLGFYHLTGRQNIVHLRLENYFYGIRREKLIKKYANFLRHLPFVRGVAIAGSQAMGQEKDSSDIDLFIVTDPSYMWLARTLVTAYFQILGKRRHGLYIANRFCLNHYLAGPKKIGSLRNLYTALEYLKLRPVVYGNSIWSFEQENSNWLKMFFPNANLKKPIGLKVSKVQEVLEKVLGGGLGKSLEKALKNWQLPKIRKEDFIIVEDDELSFHPQSKQQALLEKFFQT